HGRVEEAPLAAAVVAPVEAGVAAGVHRAGAPRIGQQALDDRVGVHALAEAGAPPRLAVVGAHHDALANGPDEDAALVRHGPPPPVERVGSLRPRLYARRAGGATG